MLATTMAAEASSTIPMVTGWVLLVEGVDPRLAEARQAEDRLGDHCATKGAPRSMPKGAATGVSALRRPVHTEGPDHVGPGLRCVSWGVWPATPSVSAVVPEGRGRHR